MNTSEAEGILAKYSAVSDIDFKVDPAVVTDENLNNIRYMIRDFAKAKQNLEEANSRNSWKSNSVPEINQEKKQDVSAIVDGIIETIEGYFKKANAFRENVPFSLDISMAEFPIVSEFMHFCARSPGFQANWVESDDLKVFFDTAEEQKERKLNKIEFLARTITRMGEDFLNQNAEERARRIDPVLKKAQSMLSEEYSDPARLIDGADDIMDLLKKAGDCLKEERSLLESLAGSLSIAVPKTRQEAETAALLAREYSADMKASEHWFVSGWNTSGEREKSIEKAKEIVAKIEKAKSVVLEEYDKAVLDIDCAGILARMDNEYTTFLGKISPAFKTDMNAIRVHRRSSVKKITYEEMLDILEKIKKYENTRAEMNINAEEFSKNLGGWYNAELTDFTAAQEAIAGFDRIRNIYKGKIPPEIRQDILSGRNVGKFLADADKLNALVSDPSVEAFEHMLSRDDLTISEKIEASDMLIMLLEALKKELTSLLKEFYSKETLFNCYDSLMCLCMLQSIEKQDENDQEMLRTMYGEMYQGGATDWKTVISRLEWAEKYVERRKNVKTNEAFDKGVASAGEFAKNTEEIAVFLDNFSKNESARMAEFDKLFAANENLEKRRLSAKLEKARSYRDSLKKFDVKAAFNDAIDRFFDLGMQDFVNKVLQSEVEPEEYEAVFMKRIAELSMEQTSEAGSGNAAEAVQEVQMPVEAEPVYEAVNEAEEVAVPETETAEFGVFRELVCEKAAKGKISKEQLVNSLFEGLLKIAETQSPVHIDIVCRQLAPLFGYVKVTPKIKDDVCTVIDAHEEGRYSLRGEYLWLNGQNAVIPRLPGEGSKPRPLDKIAPEELAAAMKIIAARQPDIKKDALFKAVAKEYGVSKLTAAMKEQLNKAYA